MRKWNPAVRAVAILCRTKTKTVCEQTTRTMSYSITDPASGRTKFKIEENFV